MEFEKTGSYYHSNILIKAWRWRHKLYAILKWLKVIFFHRKGTLEANDISALFAWDIEMGMADARMERTLTWSKLAC